MTKAIAASGASAPPAIEPIDHARALSAATAAQPKSRSRTGWLRAFEPDALARLELRMWRAYYRRQPARLFGLLVLALREQAHVSWPRALIAATWLTRGAVRFARMSGDYDRVLPDIVRGYGLLELGPDTDLAAVAAAELRWWTVRRELGLSSGEAAGEAIARLYSAVYDLPLDAVAEAGRLRGLAAEVRDRGATQDPDGPRGLGSAYWPRVAKLLRESYRSLDRALQNSPRYLG
jgi:hypothetical protein